MKRNRRKQREDGHNPELRDSPILDLKYIGNETSGRRLALVLARVLVRRALAEELPMQPQDPALREEAARSPSPRIRVKRLLKLEVMTAGELARLLGVPVARIYYHVERGAIPHRRFAELLVFPRRAVLEYFADHDV